MLALQGNTAIYMQYAHARIAGISRRADVDISMLIAEGNITLQEDAEVHLAKHIAKFPTVIAATAEDLFPNRICLYLYDLSDVYSKFYE